MGKYLYTRIIISLFLIYIQIGCSNSTDSGFCTAMACNDTLNVRLLSTTNYIPGRYSVELAFPDNVSITAEFELILEEANDGKAVDSSELQLRVIQNDSYPISWNMYEPLSDSLDIDYFGIVIVNDIIQNYTFSERITINVFRDDEIIASMPIEPDYTYYWCNGQNGACDFQQNKDAEIELTVG